MRAAPILVLALLAPAVPAPAQEPPAPDPASSGRVVDVLAASPAPASEGGPGAGAEAAGSGCPRAALAALFAASTDAEGIGPALALERETLTLCKERAELAADLFELERKLREGAGRGAGTAEPPAAAATPPPELDSGGFAAQLEAPAVAAPIVAPASEPEPPAPAPAIAPVATAAPAPTEEAGEAAAPPPPRLSWFSIIGTAGRLQAGISDGEGAWFVAEGDRVGDATVERIRSRPPAVLLTDGRELPWAGAPPRGDGR